jgi:hypothetical protein
MLIKIKLKEKKKGRFAGTMVQFLHFSEGKSDIRGGRA